MLCTRDKCNNDAIYGSQMRPRRCERHKKDDDHNLLKRPCAACSVTSLLDPADVCEACDPNWFLEIRETNYQYFRGYDRFCEFFERPKKLASASGMHMGTTAQNAENP